MVGTIVFRMILWELCKVFVIALVGITGILLMAGIIAEAQQQGLGPKQVVTAIPLLIPSTLPYTIPATTLFAACVVYGRLSADNEVLAIKACGVNVLHIVKPGMMLGLAMSLSTLMLYYHIIPYSHHLLRAMVFHDSEELIYSMLRKNGMINSPGLPYAMFVKSVQGKKLQNPVFKKRNAQGKIEMVANAREAELRVDIEHMELKIHMHYGVAIGEDGSLAYFDDKIFPVALPENFGQADNLRARDMTWRHLVERRGELYRDLDGVASEIAASEARLMLQGHPLDLPQHVHNLKQRHKFIRHQIRLLVVEMLMRPALSFGCMCFIFVGCPIGIMFSRGDYLGAFITCFLPIVLVYYPLLLAGTNMAKEGRFNEVILVYAANTVVMICGLPLFRSLLKN